MGQAQINVRTRACSGTFIARTKQAALTHNVRGKRLRRFSLPRRQFITLNRPRCGQISLLMGCDRITCLPMRREPPDHKAHCWRVPTHCIPWRPATSTRIGSRCSGMVVETVIETLRVFQTNNNNNTGVSNRTFYYIERIWKCWF